MYNKYRSFRIMDLVRTILFGYAGVAEWQTRQI